MKAKPLIVSFQANILSVMKFLFGMCDLCMYIKYSCIQYRYRLMLKNLFSSEARILLLKQFLMHSGEEFYLREIASHFNLSPRQVSLELKNLASIGLLKKRISGNQHYYSINQQHPLFEDLRNIFLKTVGLKDVIEKHLKPFEKEIDFAFIYGSIAKGNSVAGSDVDLMITGNLSVRKVSGVLMQAGSELGREVNFSIFSLNEFIERIKNKDHFITSLLRDPKIFIIGDVNEFERLAKEWMVETSSDES